MQRKAIGILPQTHTFPLPHPITPPQFPLPLPPTPAPVTTLSQRWKSDWEATGKETGELNRCIIKEKLFDQEVGGVWRYRESFRWSTHLAAEWEALCVCMPFKSSRKDTGEAPFQSKKWKNRFCRKCKRPHLFWGLVHHSSLSFLQPELSPPCLQLLPLYL